jgi:porphobilinogen synthase
MMDSPDTMTGAPVDVGAACTSRPRRLRLSAEVRGMVRETLLSPSQLVYPLFVHAGTEHSRPIPAMPGISQWSVEGAVEEARRAWDDGLRAVLLFGIPAVKDSIGSENFDPEGVIPRTIRALKAELPHLIVVSDMCCCEYTDHGHCGVVNCCGTPEYDPHLPEGYVLNEHSLNVVAQASVVHAEAGADFIAPSGMLDGMVAAIRQALDGAGLAHTSIMSYSAKYASGFYGPFREAAGSTPSFGDRAQHQMDPANCREALREVHLDIEQGADIVMVKPAMPYLDVISAVRRETTVPLAAYQVSGEYSMLNAAAANGWIDLRRCALESLTGIRRAGADIIITYFARQVRGWLEG